MSIGRISKFNEILLFDPSLPPRLPSFTPIPFQNISEIHSQRNGNLVILTENNEVYEGFVGNSEGLVKNKDLDGVKVKVLACGEYVAHCVNDQGEVFSWGKDEEFSGVLALGRMRMNQRVAIMNPNFSGMQITALSIGEKHAGAIDDCGRLYLWGTGSQGELGPIPHRPPIWEPLEIDFSSEFTENLAFSEIDCKGNCTALLTSSFYIKGEVVVMGVLGKKGRNRGVLVRDMRKVIDLAIFGNKIIVTLNNRGMIGFINKRFETTEIKDFQMRVSEFSVSAKTLLIRTESGQFLFWEIGELKKNQRIPPKRIEIPFENCRIFKNSSEIGHIIMKTVLEHFAAKKTKEKDLCGSFVNPKLREIQSEIENLFSRDKKPPQTGSLQLTALIKSLDQSFIKQRELQRPKELKTQHKIELLSQELRRLPQSKQVFPDSKIFQNPSNFSFAREKEQQTHRPLAKPRKPDHNSNEKGLEFFLNLIENKGNVPLKESIFIENGGIDENFHTTNTEFFDRTSEGLEGITRARTPENPRKSSFLNKRALIDFKSISHQSSSSKPPRPMLGDSQSLLGTKKLGKRMFTFGLEGGETNEKRKNSPLLDTNRISEINMESERTGLMSTRAENTLENLDGRKCSDDLLEIARKISGNLEELVGKLEDSHPFLDRKSMVQRQIMAKFPISENSSSQNTNMGSFVGNPTVRNRCLCSILRTLVQKRKLESFFALKEAKRLVECSRVCNLKKQEKTIALVRFVARKFRVCEVRVKRMVFNSLRVLPVSPKVPPKQKKHLASRICSIFSMICLRRGFKSWLIQSRLVRGSEILECTLRKTRVSLVFNRLKSKLRDSRALSKAFMGLYKGLRNKKMKAGFEKIREFCAWKEKNEKLATLKTLGVNKLLFALFEIFQRAVKTSFQDFCKCLKNREVIRFHNKKTSLKDIIHTMDSLAFHQSSLGLSSQSNDNPKILTQSNNGKPVKFRKIQIDCVFHVIGKLMRRRLENGFLAIRSQMSSKKKPMSTKNSNLPRKMVVSKPKEIEQIIQKSPTYAELMSQKKRASQKPIEKTLNLNNSHSDNVGVHETLNQSFGNISKILLNNSNDSDVSLFNNMNNTRERTNNNSRKLQNQLKLMSSDFHDPKDPQLLFPEPALKEDIPNGLADPHELIDPPKPILLLQDLNCLEMVSPKITDKKSRALEKNYCSLVQYKSVSPQKPQNNEIFSRDFASYLKDFKAGNNDRVLINKENSSIANTTTMLHNPNMTSKINENTSVYSANSSCTNSNYKKVIENQKRFIGNFHKQTYNTISGRIPSPSYQDYLREKKKN